MNDRSEVVLSDIGKSQSVEKSLPVENYITRLNEKLEGYSSSMSIDTQALEDGPKDGNSWSEVEHYLSCINIPKEQAKSVLLPYWGSVKLPSAEELAEPNTENYTPEDVLGRLFVVNAALGVEFEYYNKDSSRVESMTLAQLISDVYPGLEGGIKDIRKELEFAFREPEKFKKEFSDKERSSVGGLTKKAFMRKGIEVTAASLFILTSMTLASCYSSEHVQIDPSSHNREVVPRQYSDEFFHGREVPPRQYSDEFSHGRGVPPRQYSDEFSHGREVPPRQYSDEFSRGKEVPPRKDLK